MMTGADLFSDKQMIEEMNVSESTGYLKNLTKIILIFLEAKPDINYFFLLMSRIIKDGHAD